MKAGKGREGAETQNREKEEEKNEALSRGREEAI